MLTKYGGAFVMANIKQIAEHSVDISLLTGNECIDVGCRGFEFSRAMREEYGLKVWAFDIEAMVPPEGVWFRVAAVLNKAGTVRYVDTKDQQAKFIAAEGKTVACMDINDIMRECNTVDVLKLDCEGSEYIILSDPNFQPIPRQISVEFHEHAHKHLHDQYFQACMDNLLKHYVAVKHDRYAAHGAGENFWDSLFLRRDLV